MMLRVPHSERSFNQVPCPAKMKRFSSADQAGAGQAEKTPPGCTWQGGKAAPEHRWSRKSCLRVSTFDTGSIGRTPGRY